MSGGGRVDLVPATEADLDLCFEITRAAMREPVERAFGRWDEDEQRRRHAAGFDPATHRLVLVDGMVVGVLAVEIRPRDLWLSKLYLLPTHQGRGIGGRVAAHILADAACADRTVGLQVLRANGRALRFWRRLGFQRVGATPTHVRLRRAPPADVGGQGADSLGHGSPGGSTPMSIPLLRPALAADIPALFEVRLSVTENTLTPGRLSDEDVRAAIEAPGRGFVVEVGGVVEGFAIASGETGQVWALFVRPRSQGRGFGDRLHAAMLDWLATRPVERLWLTTGAETRARGFYERRGWRLAGPAPGGEVRLERPNGVGVPAGGRDARQAADEAIAAPPAAGLRLTLDEPADEADLAVVDAGLEADNAAAAPLHEVRTIACLLRDGAGRVVGGAVGRRWGPAAELLQLWVEPALRGRGLGARLLAAFEAEAGRHGCVECRLDTFSFQAPGFYERLGWRAEHVRRGYPHGIARFHMVRTLVGGPAP